MASSNKREGGRGINFGADFSELRERPILKGADLDLPTSLESAPPLEAAPAIRPAERREAVTAERAADLADDPLTKLLTAAERERGLPYTFRIPVSMDREFRT